MTYDDTMSPMPTNVDIYFERMQIVHSVDVIASVGDTSDLEIDVITQREVVNYYSIVEVCVVIFYRFLCQFCASVL